MYSVQRNSWSAPIYGPFIKDNNNQSNFDIFLNDKQNFVLTFFSSFVYNILCYVYSFYLRKQSCWNEMLFLYFSLPQHVHVNSMLNMIDLHQVIVQYPVAHLVSNSDAFSKCISLEILINRISISWEYTELELWSKQIMCIFLTPVNVFPLPGKLVLTNH